MGRALKTCLLSSLHYLAGGQSRLQNLGRAVDRDILKCLKESGNRYFSSKANVLVD
jgi:hypothetical protein